MSNFKFCQQVSIEHLYLHWPFCPYKCSFCPFVAFAGIDHYMAQYHQGLMEEISWFVANHQASNRLKTIFIGGGTPSTYPDELLLDMSGRIKSVFDFDPNLEFSIEVNPGTVKVGQLAVWKAVGINRLSIGVQSLNDQVLKRLNRHQTAAQVYDLLDQASREFDNLSVDLIVGLPGVSLDDWHQLINELVGWPIKHVSVYFLTVHENTAFYRSLIEGRVQLPLDDEVVETYHWTVERLAQAGFERYELSNFARPGYKSVHNQAYWDRKAYRGFGVGACSFDGVARSQNEKNLLKYLKMTATNCYTAIFSEKLTSKQAWLEVLMLGMRNYKGANLTELLGDLNHEQRTEFTRQLSVLQDAELIKIKENRIYLTSKGLTVENEVIVKLSV